MNPDCEKNGSGHPLEAKITEWIAAGLPDAQVKVVGDGRHFKARVITNQFAGLGLIERHRLVYAAIGENMVHVHALAMKTLTEEESQ